MSHTSAPIFLIGYRGTGKSAVAHALAERIGWVAIDSDEEIERRSGKSIFAIFAEDGEAAFRDLEADVIAACCIKTSIIVATGGGAILLEATRAAMRQAGPVVWLTATADAIEQRLACDAATASRRPNLTAGGGRAEIEAMLAERTPTYRACATFVVDTEGKTPAEVADEIVAQL